ncbi:MAG: response regulator transcription factor [Dehalococcoidia bacterium]|nr:MAG: response regulator transcription factor [Dehalococcoidia bacterium]
MRILVAEDDSRLARLVERGLTAEGHDVQVAHDGEEAIFLAKEAPPDLIVMDVMMPRVDGFEAVRRIRAERFDAPVIFLTARGEVEDRVKGLDIGGDDYLVKPFAFDELTARVRALGRRAAGAEGDVLTAGRLALDVRRHEARVDGTVVDLSPTEYRLLEHLMRHPGQALTRQAILSAVWGFDSEPEPNAVDLYVHYLRRKLGDAVAIVTVRGVGYRLDRGD